MLTQFLSTHIKSTEHTLMVMVHPYLCISHYPARNFGICYALTYGMLVVLLRCLHILEIMHGGVFLHIAGKLPYNFTVLVLHKMNKPYFRKLGKDIGNHQMTVRSLG